MPTVLTPDEIEQVIGDELGDWTYEDDCLVRSAEATTFTAGIDWVDAVAEVAEELNHHPDIDIRWTTIRFRLSTHSAGGVTSNDVQLARRIDGIVG
jgi:4a-hydroxytetrahydrobiopterin dehydratase